MPTVNRLMAMHGRPLSPADSGSAVVMLEVNFAKFYGLPASGEITISGGRELAFVGHATTPEYFTVSPEGEIFMSEANCAASPIGVTVSTRDHNASYVALTQDVENDQQMFNALAFLLISGALGAAFNLIHRLADQQRREFSIPMAMGVAPWRIALRPLLVSAQITLLGVVFGVGVGLLLGIAPQSLLESLILLPVWRTSFQVGLFAGGTVVGCLVPFVATALPIVTAVRVAPIDAIKPGHLVARSPGRASRLRSRAGNASALIPFRNLVRAPRRTALTTLAIAAIVTVLVAFLGVMDSVYATIDEAEAEALVESPDRIVVTLDVLPDRRPGVAELANASTIATAESSLRVGGTIASSSTAIDVLVMALRPATIGTVILLGVGAVAVAPVLTLRRMHRLDLPGTLRVME